MVSDPKHAHKSNLLESNSECSCIVFLLPFVDPSGLHQTVLGSDLFRWSSIKSCGSSDFWPALAWKHNASIHRGRHVEPPALLLCRESFAALFASALVSLHASGGVSSSGHCADVCCIVMYGAPLCPSASNIQQRSGLAFEFAWLPMVMFGGRLGSVLTLDHSSVGSWGKNVHKKCTRERH